MGTPKGYCTRLIKRRTSSTDGLRVFRPCVLCLTHTSEAFAPRCSLPKFLVISLQANNPRALEQRGTRFLGAHRQSILTVIRSGQRI